jgi:hypothetical protein
VKEWRFVRVMRASSSSSSIWKRHTHTHTHGGSSYSEKENETALASRQVVVVGRIGCGAHLLVVQVPRQNKKKKNEKKTKCTTLHIYVEPSIKDGAG